MNEYVCNSSSKPVYRRCLTVFGVCAFIALAAVGLLVLSSCASTPNGIQRELVLYQAATNGLATAQAIGPYAPAPASQVLEGVLAIAGAGLALWASHLHRSVRALENGAGKGNGNGAGAGPPPVSPPPN